MPWQSPWLHHHHVESDSHRGEVGMHRDKRLRGAGDTAPLTR